MTVPMNPNFPVNLQIAASSPSIHSQVQGKAFSKEAQQKAIQRYGIAGRVWEAAYLLNLYLNPPSNSRLVFDPPFQTRREGSTIVEIGSGSGLVASNVARSLNPETELLILTDLPEVCPLLEENLASISVELRENAKRDVVLVRPLSWGNHQDAFSIASELGLELEPRNFDHSGQQPRYLTHILCSDLVYFPELLAPLLRTLIQLSSPPFIPIRYTGSEHDLQIIISYKIRSLSKETPFWSAFGVWFTFEPVLVREGSITAEEIRNNCPNGDSNIDRYISGAEPKLEPKHNSKTSRWSRLGSDLEGPSFVFIARRRPESYGWNVPEKDEELLSGKGVFTDSQVPKGDDTFEQLLFMALNGDGESDDE
ncbi:hypothetical protein D9758_013335 [Tetrapyrgos nigripes]|uniref:Uncharacterized protein n=1 Tax=Tetrapyrgos nigripes TaxID=182062 RepID=A0A8H5CCL4_9AGAR|nr:hypothetical protein D9758_013335 [Tetrapyrgos nigripes]